MMLRRKSLIILIILCFCIVLIYLVLRYFILGSDPLIPLFSSILDYYLLLAEKFSNILLQLTGSEARIKDHIVVYQNSQLSGFDPQVILKKSTFVFLLLVWLTRAKIGKKITFTCILISAHFLFISIFNAAGAHMITIRDFDDSALMLPIRMGNMGLFSILVLWYYHNKESILNSLSRFKINSALLKRKLFDLIILGYLYILVPLAFYYFNFYLWMDFMLISAQKILALFGTPSSFIPLYLIGDNGAIVMEKDCLGIKTLSLFAFIVYLTGGKIKTRLIYIAGGILLLNFVNILRLVFLFTRIQKYGMDIDVDKIHDIYTYILYFIVFILWVVWFEKFSDIRHRKSRLNSV